MSQMRTTDLGKPWCDLLNNTTLIRVDAIHKAGRIVTVSGGQTTAVLVTGNVPNGGAKYNARVNRIRFGRIQKNNTTFIKRRCY